MGIVVDTSAVISVAGNEPTKLRLIELTRGEELIAPASLPWEIGNALSAMFKQKRATLEQGLKLIEQYRLIPIRLVNVAIEETLTIASARNIYAYDAYVIHCALQAGYPILSLDAGLREAARLSHAKVIEVTP